MSDVAPPGTLAEEYLPDLSSLTPDHQATFRIGQMMRLTVLMEQTARGSLEHIHLVSGERLAHKQGFQNIIGQLRETLAATEKLQPVLAIAEPALDVVSDVYRRRNRFAHDLLFRNNDDQWTQIRLTDQIKLRQTKTWDLAGMREAVLEVVSAQWRLDALYAAIHPLLTGKGLEPGSRDDQIHEGWLAILRGDFTLTEGGGVRIIRDF